MRQCARTSRDGQLVVRQCGSGTPTFQRKTRRKGMRLGMSSMRKETISDTARYIERVGTIATFNSCVTSTRGTVPQ
jgi:hypothetical protein